MDIHNAITFAALHHSGCNRKNSLNGISIPYIVHPIRVMEMIWKWEMGTQDNLMAAVCHDILEDTNVSIAELIEVIGEKATNIVQELTIRDGIYKEEYLKSFNEKSINALIIKIADRLCNVTDFAIKNFEYAKIYFDKATPVFEVFDNKKNEIQDTFGIAAYGLIAASLDEVKSMVLKHKNRISLYL